MSHPIDDEHKPQHTPSAETKRKARTKIDFDPDDLLADSWFWVSNVDCSPFVTQKKRPER